MSLKALGVCSFLDTRPPLIPFWRRPMFKKFVSLMVIFSIFSATAQASAAADLKQVFDELNYALTVEWNQQDKNFYTKQMETFNAEIRKLQEKGLTNEELIAFAKSQVKDAQVAKDVETAFNVISINKMSREEASNFMVETMKRSYNSGASFRGAVTLLAVIGAVVVVAAIATGIGFGVTTPRYCSQQYVCDNICYYDYYYGYTCYQDCYWACY